MATAQAVPAPPVAPSSTCARRLTQDPIRTPSVLSVFHCSWKLACLGVVLSVALAVLTALTYEGRREFTGSILYTPLPSAEANKHLLPTTDLKSLSALVKAPENLQAVVDGLSLPLTADALAERIDTKTTAGAQTLVISLRWPDQADGGTSVLNRVMESFVTATVRLRGRTMDERGAAFRATLASAEGDLLRVQGELSDFYRRNGIPDLPYELRLLNADLEALASASRQARRNEVIAQAQIALLDRTIERMTSAEASVQAGTTSASRASNPHRLHQLIQDERHVQQCEAQLQVKRQEYDRLVKLGRLNAVSTSELERVGGEIAVLEAQVRDNLKIQQLKQKLAESDATPETQPVLQQACSRKLEMDLQLFGARNEQELLAEDEKAKRVRLAELLTLQATAAPLARQVERLETERQRLQGHADQLRLLHEVLSSEAVVVQPAKALPRPFASARRWLVPVAVLLGSFLAWGGLMFLWQAPRQARTEKAFAVQ